MQPFELFVSVTIQETAPNAKTGFVAVSKLTKEELDQVVL